MWEGISMSKHDFGYFFHEGLSNMFSDGKGYYGRRAQ